MTKLTKEQKTVYKVEDKEFTDLEAASNAARRADLSAFWDYDTCYGEIDHDTAVETCLGKRDELISILTRNYESFFEVQE